jgi:hypothetical protein
MALNDLATANKTNQVLASVRKNLREQNQPEIAALPDYKNKQIVILSTAPAATNYAVVQDVLNQAKQEAALAPGSKLLTIDKGSIADFYNNKMVYYEKPNSDNGNQKPMFQDHKGMRSR